MSSSRWRFGRQTGGMIVVYAGRFDPVTNGHLDVVRRAARIFERTIVGVFDAPEHQTLLSTERRVRLLEQCLTGVPGVSVEPFDGLLVDFVRDRGATAIVRGVRSAGDLSRELEQALVYRDMAADIEQVYLMSDVAQAFVRASRVRELAATGHNVAHLVPEPVAAVLREIWPIRAEVGPTATSDVEILF